MSDGGGEHKQPENDRAPLKARPAKRPKDFNRYRDNKKKTRETKESDQLLSPRQEATSGYAMSTVEMGVNGIASKKWK